MTTKSQEVAEHDKIVGNEQPNDKKEVEEIALTATEQVDKYSFPSIFDSFLEKIEGLSQRYGRPKTTVIKSLIENTCDYHAQYEVQTPSYNSSDQKFDSYFTIKHEFEKNRFVQRLSATLRQHGLHPCVTTEQKDAVGVFDVLITNNKFC